MKIFWLDFLADLKKRIRHAQLRAVLSVNRELILLYWQIGRDILNRQQQHGWGAKVIDRLAADLRRAFPDTKGFSSRNLKYMRAFASAYSDEQFVQQVAAQMPWFHNCVLLEKVLWSPNFYGVQSFSFGRVYIFGVQIFMESKFLWSPKL
jgi:predicted nuclease of restriction endonuclease-like (RecB) superfamily